MAKSHLIALPEQELSALLTALQSSQYAELFAQLPAFSAALRSPIDDLLLKLAHATQEAIGEVARNTNHIEDWADDRKLARRLITQKLAQFEAQRAALATRSVETPEANDAASCGSRVQGGKYPLSDDELRQRLAKSEGGLL